jgi:hypothetical protein
LKENNKGLLNNHNESNPIKSILKEKNLKKGIGRPREQPVRSRGVIPTNVTFESIIAVKGPKRKNLNKNFHLFNGPNLYLPLKLHTGHISYFQSNHKVFFDKFV